MKPILILPAMACATLLTFCTPQKTITTAELNAENTDVIRLEPRPPQPGLPYMSRLARIINAQLASNHFETLKLDDDFSDKLYTSFLNTTDPMKILLTQEDLKNFESAKLSLDDEINSEFLTFPNKVWEVAARRAEEFLLFVKMRMDEGVEVNGEDTFETPKDFPADAQEQVRLWDRFLRNEILLMRLQKRAARENVNLPGVKKDRLYVARLDEKDRVLTRMKQYTQRLRNPSQSLATETFINCMTLLHDPHCVYSAPRDFDRRMSQLQVSFAGVGMQYSMADGVCEVQEIMKNGPIANQKVDLKPGDIIVSVAEENHSPVNLKGQLPDEVSGLIRGPKGSKVIFNVIDGDAPDSPMRSVVIRRDDVISAPLLASAKARKVTAPDGSVKNIGIITLPIFYMQTDSQKNVTRSCSDDIAKEINALQEKEKLDGIILDLRNNPGGFLPEAVNVAGLFIKNGPVVQVRERRATQVLSDNNLSVAFDGPMVCMISRQSASASEIVSGCLKDYARAVIAGDEQTFGKGTVQQVIDLTAYAQRLGLPAPTGGLNLTTAKFYRVNGATTQMEGVKSDIVIPSNSNSAEKLGERYLPHALPFDTISAPQLNTQGYTAVSPFIEELQARSQKRIEKHPFFTFFHETQAASKERDTPENKHRHTVLNENIRWETFLQDKERIESINKKLAEINKQIKADAPKGSTISEDPVLEESLSVLTDLIELQGQRN